MCFFGSERLSSSCEKDADNEEVRTKGLQRDWKNREP